MSERRLRILHVVASMNRAGLETWLMNVMRCIDRREFQFDFCVHTNAPGDYDDEIRALGGHVHRCVWGDRVWRFRRLFGEILGEHRYDVVHAHAYNFAGMVVREAARAGVPHRFAHLHTTGDGRRTTPVRFVYRKLMVRWVRRYATGVLGCTKSAFDSFFGPGVFNDPRMRVVYYGVDPRPFEEESDGHALRAELGAAGANKVWLHVGRFIEAKNHRRLIEIFDVAHRRHREHHLVLVGDGPLQPEVQRQVDSRALGSVVHFAGVRPDVPAVMKACDVMVMPSVREGLPVTLIEATAAGLPVVMTDMPGTREAVEAGCSAALMSLARSDSEWARAALDLADLPRPTVDEALSTFRCTPFTNEASARTLERIYEGCLDSPTEAGSAAPGR